MSRCEFYMGNRARDQRSSNSLASARVYAEPNDLNRVRVDLAPATTAAALFKISARCRVNYPLLRRSDG